MSQDSFEELRADYEPVKEINSHANIHVVKDIKTGELFIQKDLTSYNLSVYRHLLYHPPRNVPRILKFCEHNGILTIIEEYIRGKTLEEVLHRNGSLDLETVVNYSVEVCKIVAHLHELQPPIIHRDIKPSNIMLTPNKDLILIDMNAARFMGAVAQNADLSLMGTKGYAAPEQYYEVAADPKTDIYALGIMMNELYTGYITRKCTLGGPLGEIIEKCTHVDPENRYNNAEELIADLEALLDDGKSKHVSISSFLKKTFGKAIGQGGNE